jgi:ABC-type antimicrobial peptide transport system permease subunit
MAYSVAQRTREIGVRIAMGASSLQVARLVGMQALIPIAAGLILGLGGSGVVTRLMASQLWRVDPFDPATFATVLALLIAVVVAACSIPGKRAIQVDPTIALRSE